jgi:transcriptional regulator GlxA family with amidase domain
MIHVSILVPSASAVQESVVSVFTILDQANDHALARGGDAIFDVHLVGTADRVDLYGGHCSVTPDLRLAQTASTDLVIVPSLAGNIAEALRLNAAFIPWMRAQYAPGPNIPLPGCTAALFIADTGLVGDARCSPHWFVDAAFRKEFSYIGLIVDRTAPDERAISGTGAYSFFHRVLERAGGREVASLCAASSEAAFNQQCQSVLTVADEVARAAARRRIGTPFVEDGAANDDGAFASMFKANRRGRSASGGLNAVTPASPTRANGSTLRRLIRRVPAQARLGRRSP